MTTPTPEDVPLIDEPAAETPLDEPVEEPAASTDEEPAAAGAGSETDAEDTVEVKQASSRRKGRSSVPSWDEIMFGGSSSED